MSKTYHNLKAINCQLYNVDEKGNKIPESTYERIVLYNADRVTIEELKQMIICDKLETSPSVLIVDGVTAQLLADKCE